MFEELTATLRALSGNPKLEVKLHRRLVTGLMPEASIDIEIEADAETGLVEITLPEEVPAEAIPALRGAADREALYLRHHDAALHNQLAGAFGSPSRVLLDRAEAARVAALGGAARAGVAQNLVAYREHELQKQMERYGAEAVDPLPEAFGALLASTLTGVKPGAIAGQMLTKHRRLMTRELEADVAELQPLLENQAAYAKAVKRILARLGLASPPSSNAEFSEQNEAPELETEAASNQEVPEDGESLQPFLRPGEVVDKREGDADTRKADQGETTPQEGKGMSEEGAAHHQPTGFGSKEPYRAFTTKYDQIVHAAQLATPEELKRLREQLDRKLEEQKDITQRLAGRLKRLLVAHQLYAWDYGLDEGVLDTVRLSRIVADPAYEHIYKQEKQVTWRDTAITLLIDNSGSMRGRPILIAAMCVDILARVLERCHVKTEILGFTTAEWKGGRARAEWMQKGSPRNPGRLNELRHIIYKPADQSIRRARRNLGLMLKDGMLKENIDGEAIFWAHRRLLERPEERRLLMVISDGAPVDDATLSANDGGYLDRHLRETIRMIEHFSPVELVAIGIGHDVGAYYTRAATIRDASQLGEAMIDQLVALFSEEPDKPKARSAARR